MLYTNQQLLIHQLAAALQNVVETIHCMPCIDDFDQDVLEEAHKALEAVKKWRESHE